MEEKSGRKRSSKARSGKDRSGHLAWNEGDIVRIGWSPVPVDAFPSNEEAPTGEQSVKAYEPTDHEASPR